MAGVGKAYDVIVIGGGINGLCAAAYLQKAGLAVAVFERREEVGTHCATEEVLQPGVRASLHACGILAGFSPAYLDLELERFGLQILTSEWGYFQPFKDRKAFLSHTYDGGKLYQALASLNQKDADTLIKLAMHFGPIQEKFRDLFWFTPPSEDNWGKITDMVGSCSVMPANWHAMNGYEVLDEIYESRYFKTALEAVGLGFGIAPWHKTIGALLPVVLFTIGVSGTCRGGSHALSHALLRALVHHGGSVFQGCPVDKIIVEDGAAKGAILSKHAVFPEAEVMASRAVISDLTVRPTFLDLIGADKLPAAVVEGAKDFDYDGEILFTNFYVLKGDHRWEGGYPEEIHSAYCFNFGVEDVDDCERLRHDLEAGHLPDPPVAAGSNFQRFAQLDPSQAPPGYSTVLIWTLVPYNLADGGPEKWDELRESYADKVEDLMVDYGSNVRKIKVARYAATPLDTYRRNPSAISGTWSGGPVTPSQFYTNRPFAGCGAPRTPVDNLYISNSIWGHSTSMLSAGNICAQVVAEDLGVRQQDWWVHTGSQSNARVLQRLGFGG